MIEKSMIKPVAMILAFALFAQQAYGNQLQDCIANANEWRNYENGLTLAIYEGEMANIQVEYTHAEENINNLALGILSAYIVVVIVVAAACTVLAISTVGGGAPCFALLTEFVASSYQIMAGLVVALLAMVLAAKAARSLMATEYRDELVAGTELNFEEEVAICNLQYGG